MIENSRLKSGIVYCLENGIRLINDGRFLQLNKKFSSAIPLFILGYEEINKAIHLMDLCINEKSLTDEDYKSTFSGGSHIKKNQIQYKIQKRELEKMSEEEFNSISKFFNNKNVTWWHLSRNMAIQQAENAIILTEKFNLIKQKFLYVDYKNNEWQVFQNKFSKKVMDNLCTVLYYTAIEAYHKVEYHLDLEKMGFLEVQLTSENENKILSNPNFTEIAKLAEMFKTAKWKNARDTTTRLILSLE